MNMNIANQLRNLALTGLVAAGLLGAVERATGCVYLPTVSIEAFDDYASEVGTDEGGTDHGRFRVSRTDWESSGPLTVFYAINGNATLNTDYNLDPYTYWNLSGLIFVVQIPPGQQSADIIIKPIPDEVTPECNETVELTLLGPPFSYSYWISWLDSATVTFHDEPVVTIAATDGNASEIGPDLGTFTVTRTGGDQNGALTVNYTIATGTGQALNGTDYQDLPGYVVIPAGVASANITVTPIPDANCGEGTETVVLTLAPHNSYCVGSPYQASLSIMDAVDSDGDGLPDWWETQYQLNPNDPSGENGASGDPDEDGVSNLLEYLQGRNPRVGGTVPDTGGVVNLQLYTPLK